MSLNDQILHYTNTLSQQGLLRVRQLSDAATTELIHFDSNDYLSLAQDERIRKAYQQGYALYPAGSGASMLLSGYHPNHQALEQAFAQFLQVDACLLFSSGYAANLAVTSLLAALKAECIIDKAVHASVYDGLALSAVTTRRYKHNELTEANLKLQKAQAHSALITEGVFSMSGQIAPLSELSALCKAKGASLLVDEAHSFGVMGALGKGSVAKHKLTQHEVPLRIIPLGKAFAAQGAIVAGQQQWIDALLQAGRSVIYSTATSPALSYGLLHTLEILAAADERRQHLQYLVQFFKEQIPNSPLKWMDSPSAIQQVQLGCPHLALSYAQKLKQMGFSCSAIRTPTVNKKTTGLRVVLNYQHTAEQVSQLFECMHKIYEY